MIDLRARFGDRYRIRPEAGGTTWYETPKHERPWLLEVPCRYGIVYPQSGETLAASTDRPRIGAKLRALPGVLTARGDAEVVVPFHVDDADAVLRVLKPYRRRRLSEAERARSREVLARVRRKRTRDSLPTSGFPALESTMPTSDEAQAAPEPLRASEGAEVVVRQAAPSATHGARREDVGT